MKGWGSSSSLPGDIAEEIEMKISKLEKKLDDKDDVIRKQQELIQAQNEKLLRLEMSMA